MPSIHAHEFPIRDIFCDHFAFSIPSYQRPYSWGSDQTSELLSDLLAASEKFNLNGPFSKMEISPYFLGSIVIIKSEQAPEAEVIDGQQRLTTLSLLLSALRVSFTDEKHKSTFKSLIYEEGNALVGTTDRCRLTLREQDHDFYVENILRHATLSQLPELLKGSLTDPQRKLAQNAKDLVDQVQKISPDRRESLSAYILQHTYLVVVSTPDLDSAFRIFSVLNDRGLDLTVADILKAEIIGKIPEEEQSPFVEEWEEAEEELGTEHFAELFSNIRMIHGRNKLSTTVLKGFRESVPLLDEPKRFINEDLIPSANAFAIILAKRYESADYEADKRINRLLKLLSRLDNADWVPPAIYFLIRHSNAPAKVEKFLADLERLASVMWLLRWDVNVRVARHARILNEIENVSDLGSENSALQLTTEEQKKAVEVLDGDIYNLTPKMKRTMILLRLDEALSSGEAIYDLGLITIEHILPQTPPADSEWCAWWPDATRREREVHRIGNLALLNRMQNSAAKNWPLDKKKNKYFLGKSGASPFAITTEIVAKTEWKPKDFEDRQSRFLESLKKQWRLSD